MIVKLGDKLKNRFITIDNISILEMGIENIYLTTELNEKLVFSLKKYSIDSIIEI